MAKNYSITFKSLRARTTYVVNIGGGTGEAVALKGAASPFVTQEDDDEDMFKPVRTQTGYVRIIDDGLAADGVTAFDWKDLIPETDTSRPVTLTALPVGQATGTVVWQGYMQPQTFSGVLYGGAQEREYPVQCGLSSLDSIDVDTSLSSPHNFAYILYMFFHDLSAQYDTFKFQGGSYARGWLMMRTDMRNFLKDSGEISYNAFEALQEICRYWGWTARTQGQTVYFTCMDDAVEQDWLTLDITDLMNLTSSSGTVSGAENEVVLQGDIFISMDNDESVVYGPNRSVVKADVNPVDTVIKFAPEDLEEEMGDPSIWVGSQSDASVGYFRTQTKYYLGNNSKNMSAISQNSGGFERRVIYQSADTDTPTNADVIKIGALPGNSVLASIETKRVMTYSQGSIGITGQLFQGAKPFDADGVSILARLGIGMSRATAKWFYLSRSPESGITTAINSGWTTDDSNRFHISTNSSSIDGAALYVRTSISAPKKLSFKKIPVAVALYGYLYLDIFGIEGEDDFEIANLEITFTRESTMLPTTPSEPRSRTLPYSAETEHEYTSENNSASGDTWNADLIFASDNYMQYGYGLLMNPNGSFMEYAEYGSDTAEYPEQHLADRVTAYWSKPRGLLRTEMNVAAGSVADVSPVAKVTFAGMDYYPIGISRDWRDDVTMMTMIDME